MSQSLAQASIAGGAGQGRQDRRRTDTHFDPVHGVLGPPLPSLLKAGDDEIGGLRGADLGLGARRFGQGKQRHELRVATG